MTTEEFWKKYTEEDIFEIFEDTCEFFSKELPQEFIDDYEVGEVILETLGHHETAKKFDKVIRFANILLDKQPELYDEYFAYFNEFLIDYYCFQHNAPEVKKAFSRFIDNPLKDFDKYLDSFKKILFYQHSELLDQAISQNFKTVKESDEVIGLAEFDLAMSKYHIILQKIYIDGNETLDKSSFSAQMSEYNFNFDDKYLSSLEQGILKPQLESSELKYLFKNDRENATNILEGYFLRYMFENGFPFYLSGTIWHEMHGYWEGNNSSKKTTDSYFRVQIELFEKFLTYFSSDFFGDNKFKMISVLWGSVYVYEFLYKINVISENQFLDFIEISQRLKGIVIGRFTPDLWNANFVHSWQKPDCISETEFEEENKIFLKSITFKYGNFSFKIDSISEELSKIGELSNYIIEGEKTQKNKPDMSLLNKVFGSSSQQEASDGNGTKYEPFIVEPKAGRNDPCPCGSGKKYKKCCGK